MPRKQSFHRFFRSNQKTLFLLSFFILCSGIFFGLQRIFAISRIELVGAKTIRGLDEVNKKNLLLISAVRTEQKLFERNPEIKTITLEKRYPHTVRVTIKKARPAAQFETSDKYLILSDADRVIAIKTDLTPHMPIIRYYQKLHASDFTIGEVLTKKDISFSVFFIDHFSQVGINVDEVAIGSMNMIVLSSGNARYIFTTEKSRDEQFQIFYTLYKKADVEEIEYQALDLRFEKPIIKLKDNAL